MSTSKHGIVALALDLLVSDNYHQPLQHGGARIQIVSDFPDTRMYMPSQQSSTLYPKQAHDFDSFIHQPTIYKCWTFLMLPR